MSTTRRSQGTDPRMKLAELLKSEPTLIEELRSLFAEESATPAPSEPVEIEAAFSGTNEDAPLQSQTGKSLKYEIDAFIVGDDGNVDVEGPKALVVVYLPPTVATDHITVDVMAAGFTTEGRVKASKSA